MEPRGSQSNVFDRFMTIPMLGPLYLGTIAEAAGYDVSILNENILGRKVRMDELRDVDILCVSCMTATIERGKEIARAYVKLRRSLGRSSRTIVGGIHASMIPQDVVNDFEAAENIELHVQDGGVGRPGANELDGLGAVPGFIHGVPVFAQHLGGLLAMSLGALGFFGKPVAPAQLCPRLEKSLAR